MAAGASFIQHRQDAVECYICGCTDRLLDRGEFPLESSLCSAEPTCVPISCVMPALAIAARSIFASAISDGSLATVQVT